MSKRHVAEELPFADVSALIEEQKAAALAAFDPRAFRATLLQRLEARRKTAWAGPLRLGAACGLALLLVAWAVWAPQRRARHRSIDVRVIERALLHVATLRAAGLTATPVEPALSDDVWRIERALLTWRRQQAGTVDLERALCFAAARSGTPRSCPSYKARDVEAPGAKQRLERALIELERDGTIHRALAGRRRT